MDRFLYIAIIVAVLIIAGAVAYVAWTGEGSGNPLTIDNVLEISRPNDP